MTNEDSAVNKLNWNVYG